MPDEIKKDTAADGTALTDEQLGDTAAGGGHFWVFSSATSSVEDAESPSERDPEHLDTTAATTTTPSAMATPNLCIIQVITFGFIVSGDLS